MNAKPNDLMLSVIEFFGILIPGAVFLFLNGGWFKDQFGFEVGDLAKPKEWILSFFVSIILGHLLLGFSDFLDEIAAIPYSSKSRKKKPRWCEYLNAAKDNHLNLPKGVAETPRNYFYSAFSFLRIHNTAAVAELERLAADTKLFRSLTLLFFIQIILSLFSGSLNWLILAIIFGITGLRFLQIFDFTYALAFDLYIQVRDKEVHT